MKLNLAISALVASGASAEAIRGSKPQRNLTHLDYINNNPPLGSLKLCEGDCDKDSDCGPGLHCFKREPTSEDPVPHCSGGESDDKGKDYCTYRSCSYLWLLKMGESPDRDDGTLMADFPLGQCEGDCDKDIDCQPGLNCFQRDGTETVPSCVNRGGDPKEDYCVPFQCGPNAHAAGHTCVCNPGASGGDPNDLGVGCYAPFYTYSCSEGNVELTSIVNVLTVPGGQLDFPFPDLDDATSDVQVKVFARGDLGHTNEYYVITAEGSVPLGETTPVVHCSVIYTEDSFDITQGNFNMYVAPDNTMTIQADGTSGVGTFCAFNDVFIKLLYTSDECLI